MKKLLIGMLAALLMLGVCGWTLAEEDALEITAQCSLELGGRKNPKSLTDRKFTTYSESKAMKNPALTISSGSPVYGLYLCFQKQPESYEIQVNRGGAWETCCEGNEYVHAFYKLDGATEIRVVAQGDKKQTMGFNEVYVYGPGRIPSFVQRWEPTPEKSDLLFVVAHPEEELLYLGGCIPYYAVEKERTVALALMSYANTTRRSEFLNGLWSMGYRHYPVIGGYKTAKAKGLQEAYKTISGKNGEAAMTGWVTELIARTRPEVLVTLDENGEGGNGQRMMMADACRKAFAADPGQVKKLYLHLYGAAQDQIVFDWDAPLEKLNGRSGMGLAGYAYLYHKTQDDQEKHIFDQGIRYANNTFGLVESRVGKDEMHSDFLEHIPEENLTANTALPSEEGWTLSEVPGLPKLNEKGWLEEGEFVWADSERGHYVYISSTLRIIIQRKFDGSLPLTWFETDILCDIEAGEKMVNVEYTPEKAVGKKSRVDAAKNAAENKLVFACNSDYYTYRVGSKNGHPTGIEIRNGEIYFDDHYTELVTNFFPNLDTLAFYDDGNISVHASMELSAQEYLDRGAYMVFSFGPYLIRDGALSDWVRDPERSQAKNPRHAFGMIEPGHYVDIMCEGRLGKRSEGVTMPQLAFLCQGAGCVQACDLDGGQTAVVVFMGKQLNQIGKYDGKTSARETCEVLGIGVSDQVGTLDIR